MIRESGYDVVWSINTKEEAIQRGYPDFNPDEDRKDTVARIFIEMDVEDLVTPDLIAKCSVHNLIPLMAVSNNERLKKYAKEKLKEVE
jgi:hypothetical protein